MQLRDLRLNKGGKLSYMKPYRVVTRDMLQRLYDREQVKLQDPTYPGGGHNPPYGPRVEKTDSRFNIFSMDFADRR